MSKQFQVFASDEDRPLAERVLTEVGGDSTVVQIEDNGYILVTAPVGVVEPWKARFPAGWVGLEKVHQMPGEWWWTVNIAKALYLAAQ